MTTGTAIVTFLSHFSHVSVTSRPIRTCAYLGSNRMSWRKLDKPSSLAMDATIHAIDYANVVCLVCDVSDRVFGALPKDITDGLKERFVGLIGNHSWYAHALVLHLMGRIISA